MCCSLITLAVNREQIIFPLNFIVDRQKPGSDISGNAGQLIWQASNITSRWLHSPPVSTPSYFLPFCSYCCRYWDYTIISSDWCSNNGANSVCQLSSIMVNPTCCAHRLVAYSTILAKMCGTSCIFWRIPAIFAPSPLPHRAMLNDCSQNVFHTTTLNGGGGGGGRYELLTETHFLHKQTEDRVCRAFFKLVPHNFGQDCR